MDHVIMDDDKIEQGLISYIPEDDAYKVSKQLQIKQWAKLYGNKLLRSSLHDELDSRLHFIVQVIRDEDCWSPVDSLKAVKLDRRKVGKKLLNETTPSGEANPFNNMQKYQIACWCCFEDKITELGNQLEDNNKDTAYGPLVKYWTHVKLNKSDNDKMNESHDKWYSRIGKYQYPDISGVKDNNIELHNGFESAIRDNNKEALKYFWNHLESLSEMDKNKLLIYSATRYFLPFSKANNEKVSFVMDHLDQSQYTKLLEEDFNQNNHYSTLYNLISNFEYDNAKKLAEKLSSEKTSYFDYNTLRYRVLHQISLKVNDDKFRDAGLELLDSLKLPSNSLYSKEAYESHNEFIKSLARKGDYSPIKHLLSDIEFHLSNFLSLKSKMQDSLLWKIYNVQDKLNKSVVSSVVYNILHNTEVITLDKTKIEKANKRLRIYGDDSSDEEDTVMSYDNKTALKKLQDFNDFYKKSCVNSSFIAHAVSIKLLYSSNIQKDYYERRPDNHTYTYKTPTYDEICIAVDNSANHVVDFDPHIKQVVAHDICSKINANPYAFLRAVLNGSLKIFFEDLLIPKGKYYNGNLASGWLYELELGKLQSRFSHQSASEPTSKKHKSDHSKSNLNGVFDISDSQSHFPTRFFSTLRLYNRLEKRKLGDFSHDNNSQEVIKWKYSDSIEVKIDNKSDWPQYRADWVEFGELGKASYETIYNKVSFTMKDLEALPTIFTKGVEALKEISSNAASLHYLLFGTEVIRNPSALIHNMMMFDLIKGGQLTWDSALKNRIMPMSMTGAIMASRMKNSLFNENYMPHKYLYDTYNGFDAEGKWILIYKEKELTRAWCKMKWPEADKYFDENGDIEISKVQWLFNELQESCKTWYDIHIVGDNNPSNA